MNLDSHKNLSSQPRHGNYISTQSKKSKSRWSRLKTPKAKKILKIVGAAAVLIVVLQLLYPKNYSTPFTKIGGLKVGLSSQTNIKSAIDGQSPSAKINLITKTNNKEANLSDSGISVSSESSAKTAINYPLPLRFIPGSWLFYGLLKNPGYETSFDEAKLSSYAEKSASELYQSPTNANAHIEGEKVVTVPDVDGRVYSTDETSQALKTSKIMQNTEVKLDGSQKTADRTAKDVETTVKSTEAKIDTKLTLRVGSEVYTPSKTEVAGWLTIHENTANLELLEGYKNEGIKNYLTSINKSIYIQPGTSKITYIYGGDTKVEKGSPGHDIVYNSAIQMLIDELNKPTSQTLEIPLGDALPKVEANRDYSGDQAGLQALVNDAAKEYPGNIQIKVIEVGPRGWSSSYNSAKKTTPASTYKLFIAWLVLKNVDSGKWKLTDNALGSQTIQKCMENMIVNSDNDCAHAFGEMLGGWKVVHNSVKAAGYNGTDFSPEFYSTPDDQSTLLTRLYRRELLSQASTDLLLGFMRRQVYREGIPTGTKTTVEDKVGFLYALLHDSAIVESPSGNYILVVYTNNSSWNNIALIAKRIHTFLNSY